MTAERLLARLAEPTCYPHAPHTVQIVQTHLSVVCLADDVVYKLKKAVTLPFVDFAPLPARRHACREEVRLNRRLCPAVYLGTASLRPGPHGPRFAAIGDDEAADDLDVAVVMQRLPQARMLDELLRAHAVTAPPIAALARHVAAFHARCERPPAAVATATPHQLAGFAADNFTALREQHLAGLDANLLAALEGASRADFARIVPMLEQRAAAGWVVDGHGDLHARNICMTEPPAVYDCIEFAPAFRIGDVATEIAFLLMDLRYRSAGDLAAVFTAAYADALPASTLHLHDVLPTLCAYRAMVRAKVAMLAAAEAELPAADREGARQSAARHLRLAAAHAIETRGPWWVLVCGPPASGKSSLCAALAAVPQWPHLATDRVRKQLAGIAATARAGPEHYTAAFSARTYAELLARAAQHTRSGAPVVLLDGNFPTADVRARAAAAAQAAGARLLVVAVAIDAATAAARATARQRDPANTSDADAAIAADLGARFAAPTAAEGLAVLTVDGHADPGGLGDAVLARLLAPAAQGSC